MSSALRSSRWWERAPGAPPSRQAERDEVDCKAKDNILLYFFHCAVRHADKRGQAEREHSWTGTVDHILAHAGVKEDVPHG